MTKINIFNVVEIADGEILSIESFFTREGAISRFNRIVPELVGGVAYLNEYPTEYHYSESGNEVFIKASESPVFIN